MCGIIAILLHPQKRSAATWQAILETFTQNLLNNEPRGRSASGVAVAQLDGQVAILKMPIPATRFITLPGYHELLSQVGPDTTLLLGHTRFPTKGTPAHNENNHPLQAGPVFGVHNGRVLNDDALFASCHCPRGGEVDSEIIFRLLEMLSPGESKDDYMKAACKRLRDLQGELTFLAIDRRSPAKLLVLRHQNPLSVHFHTGWNALIFSSRYIALRKSFGPVTSRERLAHGSLLMFDALRLPRLGLEPVASFPV